MKDAIATENFEEAAKLRDEARDLESNLQLEEMTNDMSIEHFLDNSISSWMAGVGEHSDIVMSTRIRLARNLNGYRFPLAFTEDEAHKIDQSVSATF